MQESTFIQGINRGGLHHGWLPGLIKAARHCLPGLTGPAQPVLGERRSITANRLCSAVTPTTTTGRIIGRYVDEFMGKCRDMVPLRSDIFGPMDIPSLVAVLDSGLVESVSAVPVTKTAVSTQTCQPLAHSTPTSDAATGANNSTRGKSTCTQTSPTRQRSQGEQTDFHCSPEIKLARQRLMNLVIGPTVTINISPGRPGRPSVECDQAQETSSHEEEGAHSQQDSQLTTEPEGRLVLTDQQDENDGESGHSSPPELQTSSSGSEVSQVELTIDRQQPPVIREQQLIWELTPDGSRRTLGSGTFGCVYAARLSTEEGEAVVAVKRFFDCDDATKPIREGQMQMLFAASGIFPKFHGVVLLVDDVESGSVCLVTELFARGTTLRDLLVRASDSRLSNGRWLNIARQLTTGLQGIHHTGVLHNDIKDDNVLVNVSGVRNEVKYIDLGNASTHGIAFCLSEEQIATLSFLAPEVKAGQPTSRMSDVWSLGVLLSDIGAAAGIPGIEQLGEAACQLDPGKRLGLEGILAVIDEFIAFDIFQSICQ